ncbi:MarR family transcriptional regulator [Amycolatopsis sp. La24]|uniref:MarR family winged helix-turn-helix transcriptional regulator n=1 Tax=Amycolatopsis sp. La24 TaxID=3028304 RepID=UPI0023B1BEF8|nr:MarR family transcriptional regulator [Amycolatopsis sp. La24]
METEPDAHRADELATLARTVREGVGRLNWRMRSEAGSPAPGPAALAVLSRLYRGGTHTPGELAEAERIHPQSLTRILASLAEREWITRTPDPADGRRSLIEITPAGLRELRTYSIARENWLAAAVERTLSPTEQELLRLAAGLLTRIADS